MLLSDKRTISDDFLGESLFTFFTVYCCLVAAVLTISPIPILALCNRTQPSSSTVRHVLTNTYLSDSLLDLQPSGFCFRYSTLGTAVRSSISHDACHTADWLWSEFARFFHSCFPTCVKLIVGSTDIVCFEEEIDNSKD